MQVPFSRAVAKKIGVIQVAQLFGAGLAVHVVQGNKHWMHNFLFGVLLYPKEHFLQIVELVSLLSTPHL